MPDRTSPGLGRRQWLPSYSYHGPPNSLYAGRRQHEVPAPIRADVALNDAQQYDEVDDEEPAVHEQEDGSHNGERMRGERPAGELLQQPVQPRDEYGEQRRFAREELELPWV